MQIILTKTLAALEIREEHWEALTSGQSKGRTMSHFSFNHYRPEVEKVALKMHTDIGWVTLLFLLTKGLKADIGSCRELPIEPKERHVVVNFGKAMEISINDPDKLVAAWHGVEQQEEDRVSFGLFTDPFLDTMHYRMDQGEVVAVQSYDKHVSDCFGEVYKRPD